MQVYGASSGVEIQQQEQQQNHARRVLPLQTATTNGNKLLYIEAMNEEQLFEECIEQAKLALAEKEVAIGCIFYHTSWNKVLARGRNSVNVTKNATRHAELNCIDAVIKFCVEEKHDPSEIWPMVDVYCTCEPCIMCARILRHLKIRQVIYGCSNDRFGGCRSVMDVASCDKIVGEPPLQYKHGYRESDAINLLKVFYSGENLNAPEEMRKVKKMRLCLDDLMSIGGKPNEKT